MMIERKTSSGESIFVIDNVFEMKDTFHLESFAKQSFFVSISVSDLASTSNGETFFGCRLSEQDIENHGLFNSSGFQKIKHFFTNKKIERSWILVAELGTKFLYHVDSKNDSGNVGLTMLCYVNTFWHPEWGGETLFCNNYGEPEIAVACKPNRVVIFPSHILHKPSGITKDAITRYSLTTTFINE